MVEHSFQEWPERPSYTNMGTTLSYRELDELSMQFACYLQKELGLTRGERVAIMLPNTLQYPIAMIGAFPGRPRRRQRESAVHRSRTRPPA